MSTDKTLADVKPGGRVRLDDGLLPCPFCGNGAEFVPYKNNGLTLKCKSMGCIQQHQRTLRYGIEWLRTSMTEHWNARVLADRLPVADQHPDDVAVDAFAVAMKAKMAEARAKGRGGWEYPAQCTAEDLSRMLREHVEKGDPRDVANFCMMLYQRGEAIAALSAQPSPAAAVPAGWKLAPIEPTWSMRNDGREFLIDGIEKEPERLAYFLWKTMINAAPEVP
ncbi:hypothetical protein [Stenotrophomonas maltophilia]|uniref:hypothetical protein n=1 Tax=Stenotrophomonas maltophilia TaxID=40324 RepID=UPI0007EF4A7E|nr:hypothetical protein [Stenotrophomonas maltophilia]OBU52258.1 hypothetical protein A9K69_16370 [Stenotrophomonas maltophilia]